MKINIPLSTICKFIVVIVLTFAMNATVLYAAETSFSWRPNSESPISGYKIHYGEAPGDYPKVVTINAPQVIAGRIHATLQELDEETTYYAVITAYTATLESPFSDEISWTTGSSSGSDIPPTPRIIAVKERD